jgi:hypothetical protein
MIQMDVPAAFGFAQLFAWCGRQRLKQEEPSISGRFTIVSVAYALGVIGPCALYLYGGWPEWETMYWFEPIRMDTANFGNLLLALVGPLFLFVLAISAGTGFLLAHRWIRAGQLRRIQAGICVGLGLSVGVVLLTPSAPMFVGHLQNYRAYIHDAIASGRAWDYGVIALGPWVGGIPLAAHRDLLAEYHLITCFEPRFFFALLIDSLIYFGFAAALAWWFYRQKPEQLVAPRSVVVAGQPAGSERKEVEYVCHSRSFSA